MLKLCLFAVAIHILFLYSIFDLYFTSPLVPATRHFSSSGYPAAKRLVLFVCDGLRVDKFFNNDVKYSPYLRSVMRRGGMFGISNTKVPTESRPGHVAMIAGFYEDVAAITKGWKENPVEFDSLFNQTRHTWAWGSPDILPMFARGAVPGRVSIDMYDSSFEDFAKNASVLDAWVFDHVEQFFSQQSESKLATALESESDLLSNDRLVFFLHLLGTDTIGHADKPHSRKYAENIAFVDHGVAKMVKLITNYFKDEKTAFIFSSDHGMRDWGSHGAGHPDETMTPFIGWGAGFTNGIGRNEENIDFSDIEKYPQMEQADIAPMMACLIGASYPANSVGRVPVNFLNGVDEKYKADCLLANAQQLAETALNLHKAYKSGSLLSFSPYPDFDIDLIEQNLAVMKDSAERGQLKAVQTQANVFMNHMLAASKYYHTYNNTYIGFAVSSGFLLWIAYVITNLLTDYFNSGDIASSAFYSAKNFLLFTFSAVVFMILLLKRSPLSHYAYWLLPVYLGCQVLLGMQSQGGDFICRHFLYSPKSYLSSLAVLCGLEAVVWSYWYRRALVVAVVGAATFGATFTSANFFFPLAILCLSVFPMLPPADSGQQAFELVYAVMIVVGCVIFFFSSRIEYLKPHCPRAKHFQLLLLAGALLVKIVTVQAIAHNQHVPVACHVLSWLFLLVAWLPVFHTCPTSPDRLCSIFLSLFTLYSLLSVYYESLYLVVLQVVLLMWTQCSSSRRSPGFGSMIADCFLLVIFINVSLLAPANVAVINSFDLVSVYTFLTLFAPFIIMTLLIIKVAIPLVCVVIAFVHVCNQMQYSMTTSLLLVMALSDFTALHFFFAVRTEGSWLEIGTSLSHYCIQMFTAVALIPLVAISRSLLFSRFCHKSALKTA